MRKRYLIFPVLLILFSCNESVNKTYQNRFFSMHTYFESQATLLAGTSNRVVKRITKDGKTEEKQLSNVDWKRELRPFQDSDINRPAWFKGYHIDSIRTSTGLQLLYTAMESRLAVRKITVELMADTVHSITVSIEKSNAYFSSTQLLKYFPGKGYHISGRQKVILADPIQYEIAAEFK